MDETNTTVSHKAIKDWVESRQAKPAAINEDNMIGSLKLIFPKEELGNKVEAITWEKWFEKFEEEGLAFLSIDKLKTDEKSHFYQFVKRAEGEPADLKKVKSTDLLTEIKNWAKTRGAIPSSIKGTEDEGEIAGILTFDFSGDSQLEPLSWEEFYKKFEKENLEFKYRELEPGGEYSHWFEFENKM